MAVDVEFLNGNNVNNINTNFQRVKNALQEVVGRNGNLPNHMNADLDMNSNDILNVGKVDADSVVIQGLPIGQFNGTYKGLWEASTTYVVNDVVRDTAGNLWIAKTTNTNSTPIEGADWTLFIPVPDGVTDGDKGDIIVSDSGTKWQLTRNFKTVPDLLTDTTMGYQGSGASVIVEEGDIVTVGGYRYVVAADDASDEHEETAGGIKLYEAGPSFTHIDRLRRLPGHDGASATLTQSGREGVFKWVGADLSSFVAIDTYRGVYAPPLTDPTGTSGAWVRVVDGPILFDWFGPAKDGTTDDTAKFDSAVTYVSSVKGRLLIPTGDYAISDATLKSNMHLEFAPGARFLQGTLGTSVSKVLYGTGTVGTGVALTANAALGAASVTVASGGTAFTAGSYALVYDNDYVFPMSAGRNQEVVRILSSTTTTITFTKPLTTAFTTANSAQIAPLVPLENLTISGYGDVVVGTNKAFGIMLQYPVNCQIRDGVTVRQPRSGGAFVFQTGFNSHISHCSAFDGQTQTSGLGYAVSFDESCTFCSVSYCHFENVRENTFTNRTRWCEFSHNTCVDIADTGWNTHGAGSDHNICRDNTFRNCSQGVAVGWSGASRADSYNIVENNVMVRCDNGISVNTPSGQRATGNVVKGNVIEAPASIGIYCNYQNKPVIEGNVIKGITTTPVNGIYINNSADASVANNTVSDATNASGTSLRVDASTDVLVHNNRVVRASGTSFYVPAGSTNVDVVNNMLQNAGAESLGGADQNKFNSWNA